MKILVMHLMNSEAFFEALKEKANGNHEKAIDFLKKCQEINELKVLFILN